jgi:hypothetical protein
MCLTLRHRAFLSAKAPATADERNPFSGALFRLWRFPAWETLHPEKAPPLRPMKTTPFLLAPAAMIFCPLLLAGPGDFAFSTSKIEAPSLFLANPSPTPHRPEINSAFSFSGGPVSLLQASPLVPAPATFAAIAQAVLPSRLVFSSTPDRMPVLKPNPSVDYKLTVKDPGFHQDDGVIDGRPDLRPDKK